MGLDMYLTKQSYVKNWEHTSAENKHEITIKRGGNIRDDIKPNRICYITEDIGYWRKANQIHSWFVEHCQKGVDDCRRVSVGREQLEELLEICKKVMGSIELVDAKIANGHTFKNRKEEPILEDGKIIKDPSVAKELLPSSDGFFFSNTEYNQWYVEDIEHTIEILEEALGGTDYGDFYYQSSW
jgi:hypothetical protein